MPRGFLVRHLELWVHMPRQVGAIHGAADRSGRPVSATQSAADHVSPLADARLDTARLRAIAATANVPPRSTDQAAAARATADCGVVRDAAVWVTECAWCERVRSVAGEWQTLIPAVRAAMGAERTHGVCPRCAHGLFSRAQRDGPPSQ